MMMVAVVAAADCLRQVLDFGKLPTGRGIREIRRKLVQFAGGGRIAAGLRAFCRGLKVGGDLRSDLLVLSGVRLLQILEFSDHLRERRKLAGVLLLYGGRPAKAAGSAGIVVSKGSALIRVGENRLDVTA